MSARANLAVEQGVPLPQTQAMCLATSTNRAHQKGPAAGWKTPKFEYVNGYKFVETDGRTFRVYDGSDEVGEDSHILVRPRHMPDLSARAMRRYQAILVHVPNLTC